MQRRGWGASTTAVHAGTPWDPETGAVGTPIAQTATFLYPRKRRRDGRWEEDHSYIYTRSGNPTIRALETKVAALERAERTLAFGSGMAAIASGVLAHVGAGVRLVSQAEIYGGAWIFLERQVKKLGVDVAFTSSYDADEIADLVDERTALVYTELPTNPFNRLVDLPRLARRLRERFGRRAPPIATDATLATPLNFRPLEAGAALSVHSATKYLNGHSDLIAGVASGSEKTMERVRPWREELGGVLDPHQAFLLERGLKTLAVRLPRAEANARAVARFLDGHRKVGEVHHLSLDSHPDRRLGRRLLKGPGALLSFRLRAKGRTGAVRLLTHLELFAPAPSLGGVESLATIPRETSHRKHTEAEARAVGITPNLVRLAVGIEDAADLVSDLRRGLAHV